MRKMFPFTWVKNVYNLRIVGGKNSGRLFTPPFPALFSPHDSVNNHLVLPFFIPAFFTDSSTGFLRKLPLLFDSYPRFPHPLLLLTPKEN